MTDYLAVTAVSGFFLKYLDMFVVLLRQESEITATKWANRRLESEREAWHLLLHNDVNWEVMTGEMASQGPRLHLDHCATV